MVISKEQKQQIEDAVRDAEQVTSAEIIPMLVGRSDSYPGARWRVATAFALLSAFTLHRLRPDLASETYLWIQFPALVVGHFLGSLRSIQRFFLSSAKMDEEVHQRAIQAFYQKGLTGTQGRNGVLILVSLLEHRVQVVVDSGILAQLKPQTWEQLVAQLIVKIRAGALAQGLSDAVLECGKILAPHFPRSTGDVNELPSKLIVEE